SLSPRGVGACVLACAMVRRDAPEPLALGAWLTVAAAMAFPSIPHPNPTALLLGFRPPPLRAHAPRPGRAHSPGAAARLRRAADRGEASGSARRPRRPGRRLPARPRPGGDRRRGAPER